MDEVFAKVQNSQDNFIFILTFYYKFEKNLEGFSMQGNVQTCRFSIAVTVCNPEMRYV